MLINNYNYYLRLNIKTIITIYILTNNTNGYFFDIIANKSAIFSTFLLKFRLFMNSFQYSSSIFLKLMLFNNYLPHYLRDLVMDV